MVRLITMMKLIVIPALGLLVAHLRNQVALLPSSISPCRKNPSSLICAGSARVTTCLQSLGLRSSFGVDHKRHKHAGKILVADLTTKTGQDLCWSWIMSPSCMGVFCAPPCGTCSRARGIPIQLPNGLKIAGPQPLRTDQQPDGVMHMSYVNRQRVSQANLLYKFVTKVALFCIEMGMLVVIENPRSSLYWKTSFFAPLKRLHTFTAHQACAYGSERPKWTALAHNTKALLQLCKCCPGISKAHKHKPWGMVYGNDSERKFSTAEETAYPMPLAYAIAYYLAQELISMGWRPPAIEFASPETMTYQYLRSIVGQQPKASKVPPLLSEFAHVLPIASNHSPPVLPGQQLKATWNGAPTGSRLLSRPPLRLKWGNNSGDNNLDVNSLRGNNSVGDSEASADQFEPATFFFGVYRTCDEFVKDAVRAGHPIGKQTKLPAALQEAVEFVSSNTMYEVAKHRHDTLAFWLERAKLLSAKETELHDNLHKSLKRILEPKRLLLWKEMLQFYGYPDQEVFEEVIHGTRLAGAAPDVPSFDPCFKPAKLTLKELEDTAKTSRAALLATVRSTGDAEIDETVFQKTLEELECGWLEGPIPFSDLPDNAIVSRRFGIRQTSGDTIKIRLIDDFSASGVNDTVQVESAAKLHTLDVAAALCMELLKVSGDQQWLGKTIDLSSAYRQLGISRESKWVPYTAVFDPKTRRPAFFAMRALPFGASNSVYSFLRVAHSLWWLGCKALRLIWSNFFDDFITLARSKEAELVAITAQQFFKLLGWAVSLGDKDRPFDQTFKALGVEIDCTRWTSGVVSFANTSKRVEELVTTIDKILASGTMSSQEALVLRGRMQFAKAQIWGRASKLCLNAVTSHAYHGASSALDAHTIDCLAAFRECLKSSRPREITPLWDVPFYLFTDASFNPEDKDWPCGLGGVLVNNCGQQISAFSVPLLPTDLLMLGYPEKSTVIFEAELLALIVALIVWRKVLRHRPCVAYIDNNSTRDVSISGTARTQPGRSLVAQLLEAEDVWGILAWYTRVPSSSNIADAPSRGKADGIVTKLLPAEFVRLVVNKCLSKIEQPG